MVYRIGEPEYDNLDNRQGRQMNFVVAVFAFGIRWFQQAKVIQIRRHGQRTSFRGYET